MSGYQGDIIKSQKDRETGEDIGVKMVMPEGVDHDDATLLHRLIDKRPESISLSQQSQGGLETVDSSTFYALMDGDETAVRNRLGTSKDLSDSQLSLLVKTRGKAAEKEYGETLLERMLTGDQQDADKRPGADKGRFRWYYIYSPDVNEQLEEQLLQRQHDDRQSTFTNIILASILADNYGGRYDTTNKVYHDTFGGQYSSFGYTDKLGNITTYSGSFIDAIAHTMTIPTGEVIDIHPNILNEEAAAGEEQLAQTASILDSDTENELMANYRAMHDAPTSSTLNDKALEKGYKAAHDSPESHDHEGDDAIAPPAAGMETSAPSPEATLDSIFKCDEFQEAAAETEGGGREVAAKRIKHCKAPTTAVEYKAREKLQLRNKRSGRATNNFSAADKNMLLLLKAAIQDDPHLKLKYAANVIKIVEKTLEDGHVSRREMRKVYKEMGLNGPEGAKILAHLAEHGLSLDSHAVRFAKFVGSQFANSSFGLALKGSMSDVFNNFAAKKGDSSPIKKLEVESPSETSTAETKSQPTAQTIKAVKRSVLGL